MSHTDLQQNYKHQFQLDHLKSDHNGQLTERIFRNSHLNQDMNDMITSRNMPLQKQLIWLSRDESSTQRYDQSILDTNDDFTERLSSILQQNNLTKIFELFQIMRARLLQFATHQSISMEDRLDLFENIAKFKAKLQYWPQIDQNKVQMSTIKELIQKIGYLRYENTRLRLMNKRLIEKVASDGIDWDQNENYMLSQSLSDHQEDQSLASQQIHDQVNRINSKVVQMAQNRQLISQQATKHYDCQHFELVEHSKVGESNITTYSTSNSGSLIRRYDCALRQTVHILKETFKDYITSAGHLLKHNKLKQVYRISVDYKNYSTKQANTSVQYLNLSQNFCQLIKNLSTQIRRLIEADKENFQAHNIDNH